MCRGFPLMHTHIGGQVATATPAVVAKGVSGRRPTSHACTACRMMWSSFGQEFCAHWKDSTLTTRTTSQVCDGHAGGVNNGGEEGEEGDTSRVGKSRFQCLMPSVGSCFMCFMWKQMPSTASSPPLSTRPSDPPTQPPTSHGAFHARSTPLVRLRQGVGSAAQGRGWGVQRLVTAGMHNFGWGHGVPR